MANEHTEAANRGSYDAPAVKPPLTTNHWLWIGAAAFLGVAVLAWFALLHIPPKGGLQAVHFTLPLFPTVIGLICLVPAWLGVGSESVADPYRHGVNVALANLEASAARLREPAPPPSFEVRCRPKGFLGKLVHLIHRADNELLFVSLSIPLPDAGQPDRTKRATQQMAMVGGAAGGAVAGVMSMINQHEVEHCMRRRRAVQSAAGLDALRRFAEEDPESFVLPIDGLQEIHIDEPSFWERISSSGETRGKVRFVHRDRGTIVAHLHSFADAAAALQTLRGWFGDAVQIHLSLR